LPPPPHPPHPPPPTRRSSDLAPVGHVQAAEAQSKLSRTNSSSSRCRSAAISSSIVFPPYASAGRRATPASRPGFSLRSKRSAVRSEEHTSELQSRGHLVCRLL